MRDYDDCMFGLWIGVIVTTVIIMGTMFLFDRDPESIKKKCEMEAIVHGHAEYVINTNNNTPRMEFKWK